jgi:hypothetical protein
MPDDGCAACKSNSMLAGAIMMASVMQQIDLIAARARAMPLYEHLGRLQHRRVVQPP